jgi:hypothetical protein
LLLVIAAICAAVAVSKLKPRPPPHFPSLTSRLRVAVKASPVKPAQIATARDTAAAVLQAPSAPAARANRAVPKIELRPALDSRAMRAGLIVVGTLLGWAAVRRRHQARRMEA